MKITRNLKTNETSVEIDGESHTELWSKLAQIDEVFGEKECGKCGSSIRYTTRQGEKSNGKKFTCYELVCNSLSCYAKKSFGVKDDQNNTMFPHRKDGDGNYLPDNGWTRWNKETQTLE